MKRRTVLKAMAAGLPALASGAWAQNPGGPRTVGVLSPNKAPTEEEWRRSPMVLRMAERGWVRGKNFFINRPELPGGEAALSVMAQQLVRDRVDVIYCNGPEAAIAAARATSTIPIVFWGVAYPVEQGLVESLARPGRNVTGMAFNPGFGNQKIMEVLREAAPWTRVVVTLRTMSTMVHVNGSAVMDSGTSMAEAAERLGFEYRPLPVATSEDFDNAFASTLALRADAVVAPGTTTTWRARHRITDFALRHRLATAFNMQEFVDAGGLFSYGADTTETFYQAVNYVDRIFRGAKPAELPVEMPSKYYLTINLKTAMQIGLSFPQSILLRADRVVE